MSRDQDASKPECSRLHIRVKGSRKGVFELSGKALEIGRGAQADIDLSDDPQVSPRHLAVAPAPSGRGWVLIDHGSSDAGTSIGRRLVGASVPLVDGDEIRIGERTSIRFEAGRDDRDRVTGAAAPLLDLEAASASSLVRRILKPQSLEIPSLSPSLTSTGSIADVAPSAGGDRLQVLLAIAHLLSHPEPLQAKLSRIVDLLFEIFDFQEAALVRWEEENGQKVLVSRRRGGTDGPGLKPSQTILDRVRAERVAVLTEDAAGEIGSLSLVDEDVRLCACVPLNARSGSLGALYAVRSGKRGDRTLARDDLEYLSAFAAEAAVAIENTELYQRAQKEGELRERLARFFPPTALPHVLTSTSDGEVGKGRATRAAILFADIRNYTGLGRRLSSSQLAGVLDRYYSATVPEIFARDGVVEKFIGDAVCAFWAPPTVQDDLGFRAVSAARAIRDRIADLNDTRPDGVDSIEVGYGLAVGEVFVSHLGDENYLQLAAIGEPTTLAARLCGVARGGQILVSEALAQDLGDKLPPGEKQELTLKGYDAPVTARTV